MAKVLLLNPPGNLPYIRDYYCSKVSKGSYIYPPTDLVVLSGIIAEKYDVAVLDAMALGMDAGACMTEIGNIGPKAIVALAGAVSYHEDAPFLENIKRRYDVPIIVTGDLFLEDGEAILKNHPFLDAILMDFTNADVIAYLSGEEDKIKNMIYRKGNEPHPHLNPLPDGEEISLPLIPSHQGRGIPSPLVGEERKRLPSPLWGEGQGEGDFQAEEEGIKNMIYRRGNEIVKKTSLRTAEKEYTIPIPRHELFMNNYNYPFVRRRPFATVLTDYGCPYHCSFCVIETLGFKQRPVDNVIAELRYLKTLGFREIYFNDQTFGIKRTRAEELCDRIAKEGLGFGWVCWSRVDVINEELLKLMKGAGCHTILFGVETASEKSLKSMGKGYTLREVEETFRLCKKYGVRTLATYILGLPGENKKDIIKTIEFAIKLDSDFVSFNTLIPRAGTQIRQYAINSGWIAEGNIRMDQSGTYAVMGNEALTGDEIVELKSYAVKHFYGRPSYIAKRFLGVRSLYEFKRLIMDGKEVLFGGYGG